MCKKCSLSKKLFAKYKSNMYIFDLLKDVDVKNFNQLKNINIEEITNKAQKVVKNGLFFCYASVENIGENFSEIAVKNGNIAIVTEKPLKNINVLQILVSDARKAMSQIAKNFYEISDDLTFIGVTGTNGKTTVTTIISKILEFAKMPTGLIGTEGCFFGDKKIDRGLTTPDPIELFMIIRQMQDAGIKNIVMEVSAHAIDLRKIAGINFKVKILTNITEDHLDYFKTMENYSRTKLKFLSDGNSLKIACANDATCRQIADASFYGIYENSIKNQKKSIKNAENNANFSNFQLNYDLNYAKDLEIKVKKSDIKDNGSKFVFTLNGVNYICKNNFIGDYNVNNLLASILCTYKLGIDIFTILKAIKTIKPVVGRLNLYKTKNDIDVVIDFAHTPDGLKNVLLAMRNVCQGKLICVFGCGGNRDAKKRPIMGEIAETLSDYVIVTNDNPRFEDENVIASQIELGMKNINHKIILDRKKAIAYASLIAQPKDIVLLCGKGAENYQDINGIKYPYDEFSETKKYFQI